MTPPPPTTSATIPKKKKKKKIFFSSLHTHTYTTAMPIHRELKEVKDKKVRKSKNVKGSTAEAEEVEAYGNFLDAYFDGVVVMEGIGGLINLAVRESLPFVIQTVRRNIEVESDNRVLRIKKSGVYRYSYTVQGVPARASNLSPLTFGLTTASTLLPSIYTVFPGTVATSGGPVLESTLLRTVQSTGFIRLLRGTYIALRNLGDDTVILRAVQTATDPNVGVSVASLVLDRIGDFLVDETTTTKKKKKNKKDESDQKTQEEKKKKKQKEESVPLSPPVPTPFSLKGVRGVRRRSNKDVGTTTTTTTVSRKKKSHHQRSPRSHTRV